MTTPTLVFMDTETTSLRPDRRAWEVAVIVRPAGGTRTDDVEHHWMIDIAELDLGNADPMSLKISKFYERHPQMQIEFPLGGQVHSESYVFSKVEQLTRFAWGVGAVPNFDTEVMAARMRSRNICPSWHYHLVDVENLAAGALALPPPWGFDDLLGKFGLVYDEADRHTAMGDTRMARDLYDAVMAGPGWRMTPEVLAQLFHETYERLAPQHGYRTREASAKPWADVPEQNRALMVATCRELITAGAALAPPAPLRLVPPLAEPADAPA